MRNVSETFDVAERESSSGEAGTVSEMGGPESCEIDDRAGRGRCSKPLAVTGPTSSELRLEWVVGDVTGGAGVWGVLGVEIEASERRLGGTRY